MNHLCHFYINKIYASEMLEETPQPPQIQFILSLQDDFLSQLKTKILIISIIICNILKFQMEY